MMIMTFKEVYCHNCGIILARYNTKYFTDSNIDDLVRQHHHYHIKHGHVIVARFPARDS